MSTRPAARPAAPARAPAAKDARRKSAARTREARQAARRQRIIRRRRISAIVIVAALTGMLAAAILPRLPDAVRELTLPLHHEDIIRQQSREKKVDASLVAAVIYSESRFRDQTSHAGARGLMQITPDTANYIAHLSGGTSFSEGDLSTPQINIAYGTFYLRYLLRRYEGNEVLALAAYNGGEGNVDRWIREGRGGSDGFQAADVPFSETRHYIDAVLDARKSYRTKYASELGY